MVKFKNLLVFMYHILAKYHEFSSTLRVNLKPTISSFSPFVYKTLGLPIRKKQERTTRVHKHIEMKI